MNQKTLLASTLQALFIFFSHPGVESRDTGRFVRRGEVSGVSVNLLQDVVIFDKNIDWTRGTIYNATAPVLTTEPSQMPDRISIRGASDKDDEILTSVNIGTSTCDPASYSTTDKLTIKFEKNSWKITNGGKFGWVHYEYKHSASAPAGSLVGELKLSDSPFSLMASITDKNDGKYTINYQSGKLMGLPDYDLISVMIAVSEHDKKCGSKH